MDFIIFNLDQFPLVSNREYVFICNFEPFGYKQCNDMKQIMDTTA